MKNTFSYPLLAILIGFFSHANLFSQDYNKVKFGEPFPIELAGYSYPKDPEAAAVILYDKGEVKVAAINGYLWRMTTVHRKIKVLDAKAFGDAIQAINFYSTKGFREGIFDISAITHNGSHKSYVESDAFFTKDIGSNWKQKSFTFPNVQDQSLLEFTYTIQSPIFQTFAWNFQDEYPVIYSEYITEIPGNYEYRIGFRGHFELDSHDNHIKDNCFSISGLGDAADCYYHKYVMKDLPAFKEEDFMLSKDNYISQLRYELKQHMNFKGEKEYFTKDWDDVDDEFRYHDALGRQLNNKNFFEKNLPESLFTIADPLEKAKAIYAAIQQHYKWNGYYRLFTDIDVRDAFERGSANIAEINLSLINALQAADLDAYISLSATRDQSVPTELYPVLTEYNYLMAYLKIGDQEYYLDASDKFAPFGLVPYHALNYKARILDFKKGSYWRPINAYARNQSYFNIQARMDNAGHLLGDVKKMNSGYFGKKIRETRKSMSHERYADSIAKNFELLKYEVIDEDAIDEPIQEVYSIQMDMEEINGEYYLNPFFLLLASEFNENPFKLDRRDYPIDMGYTKNITYMMSLDLSTGYTPSFIPENRALQLPDGLGLCQLVYSQGGEKITLRLQVKLNQAHIGSEYYPALKKFFAEMVAAKTKDVIILKKA